MSKLNTIPSGRLCSCGRHVRSVSHMAYEVSPEPMKENMRTTAYNIMVQDQIAEKGRQIAEAESAAQAMLEALTPMIKPYGGEVSGKTYSMPRHRYAAGDFVPIKTETHTPTGFEIRSAPVPKAPPVKSIPSAKTYEQLYWRYVSMPTDDALATDKALRDLISVVNLKTEHIVDTVRKAPKKAIDNTFPFIAGFIGTVLGISLAWIIVIFTHI